ncbi:70 kDa peptidyl-prolyl isomerase-like protein [Tanacetum coccineum]
MGERVKVNLREVSDDGGSGGDGGGSGGEVIRSGSGRVVVEKALWEMVTNERIEAAGKKKEGNVLFKSVDYVNEDGVFGDDDQKLIKSLRVSCWLNGAACSLKLNDYQEAIKLCSKVLDVEFYNVKALYRRAHAYMETLDLQLAELDIRKALETDPNNRVHVLGKTVKYIMYY